MGRGTAGMGRKGGPLAPLVDGLRELRELQKQGAVEAHDVARHTREALAQLVATPQHTSYTKPGWRGVCKRVPRGGGSRQRRALDSSLFGSFDDIVERRRGGGSGPYAPKMSRQPCHPDLASRHSQ